MVDPKCDISNVLAEYARTRSERLRNLLMEYYLHLVKRVALRIHTKLPREVDVDDLVSAGTFGLMYAISAFDLGRKVKFETYCASRIRGAILDELRSWDWVPRLARLRSHKLSNAANELKIELGREPTHDELAKRLKVSMGELGKITRDGRVVRVMPISGRRAVNDDSDYEEEILEDRRATDRERGIEREDLKRLITGDLSRAEQLIIMLYYFEGMTMKEIGSTLDLSESRVSQMHSAILARLQAKLGQHKPELEKMAA